MRILCIGDIVSESGRDMVEKHLPKLTNEEKIDFVVANGENSSHGRGMSRKCYEQLSSCGINAFTMGNHTWNCKDITNILTYNKNVIRPANYDASCPGSGSTVLCTKAGEKIGIINIIGRTYMDPANSPFDAVFEEINKIKNHTKIILVDFHAEATSEKIAMGWYLNGHVSAVFGTHTHVQTADETILPKGTGYITDLGMTGPIYSVLGMDRNIVVDRFLNGMPQKFQVATGAGRFSGCIFDINSDGITTEVKRIRIEEDSTNK